MAHPKKGRKVALVAGLALVVLSVATVLTCPLRTFAQEFVNAGTKRILEVRFSRLGMPEGSSVESLRRRRQW